MLKYSARICVGSLCSGTGRLPTTPVGEVFLGRTVDCTGRVLDGEPAPTNYEERLLDNPSPGILDRVGVSEPLFTGITAIDAMIPIGRGQREVVIGDRKTGKTTVLLNIILSQRTALVRCIYAPICTPAQRLATLLRSLKELPVSPKPATYLTTVFAGADAAPGAQIYTPNAAASHAEYYMLKGEHAVAMYDDLTRHASAYRQLSLLLRRPPGREAYPGDMFYLHARLLERAAKLSPRCGGGSLTAIPVLEIQDGDISTFLPTNVISITDGQIILSTELFTEQLRPAINMGLSVSRVGSACQLYAMKRLAGDLRVRLAVYEELVEYAKIAGELDKETQAKLREGECLRSILVQKTTQTLTPDQQLALIYAATRTDLLTIIKPDLMQKATLLLLEELDNFLAEGPFSKASSGDELTTATDNLTERLTQLACSPAWKGQMQVWQREN